MYGGAVGRFGDGHAAHTSAAATAMAARARPTSLAHGGQSRHDGRHNVTTCTTAVSCRPASTAAAGIAVTPAAAAAADRRWLRAAGGCGDGGCVRRRLRRRRLRWRLLRRWLLRRPRLRRRPCGCAVAPAAVCAAAGGLLHGLATDIVTVYRHGACEAGARRRRDDGSGHVADRVPRRRRRAGRLGRQRLRHVRSDAAGDSRPTGFLPRRDLPLEADEHSGPAGR